MTPSLRQLIDLIESAQTVTEFVPGGIYRPPIVPRDAGPDPWNDDPRSQTVQAVQRLLSAGKTVFVVVPGVKGRVIGTQITNELSWLVVQHNGWGDPKTRSRSRLSLRLEADDDSRLHITAGSQFRDKKGRPFDYTVTGQLDATQRTNW